MTTDAIGASPTELLVVLCTVPDDTVARALADRLVSRRLAACVNILPGILSVYRWKGQIERESELLLLIKTRAARFVELRDALVEAHPYEIPEVIAMPVCDGYLPYLAWLQEQTTAPDSQAR